MAASPSIVSGVVALRAQVLRTLGVRSVSAVAAEMDVSRTTLRALLEGKPCNPTLDTLARIERWLKTQDQGTQGADHE